MLVHPCQDGREQVAIALLLAGAIARDAGGREGTPQLGSARGLGGLATRQHAVLEAAEHDRSRRRESRDADADGAHTPTRHTVPQP
ncbi:MAG TPA: hypothetical protein VLK59_02635, partial [Solirubrobacteraceae bacterium]|nr:hypothetical protein [Solirubrobacteraceae bacterium]